MYRLGQAEKPHRHTFRYVLAGLVVVGAIAGGFMVVDSRRNSRIITSSTPVHKGVMPAVTTPMKKITEPWFSLDLPQDYTETERTVSPRTITWQSTDKRTTARSLKIYIDTIPTNLPLNRLLPIHVSDNAIVPGDVSDNCASFVGPPNMNPNLAGKAKPTPGKWQGISFICDLPNYLREVAGTATDDPGGPAISLRSSQGNHHYMFVYTDHTSQPDFIIFKAILSSFRAAP